MWNSYDSPQMRRLRSDHEAMIRLREESSVLKFKSAGKPPQRYMVEFHGGSLTREGGKISVRSKHQVEIKLGASYPRSMPEIRWITPIYHPNISEIGMVCLGGYGTHWVPSLRLDALCAMLWDMCRYFNYDVRSPYNRDAALWVAHQTAFRFPIDTRPLRDVRASQGRIESPATERIPRTGADEEPETADSPADPVDPTPKPAPEAAEPVLLIGLSPAAPDPRPSNTPTTPSAPPIAAVQPQDDILIILD